MVNSPLFVNIIPMEKASNGLKTFDELLGDGRLINFGKI